MPKVNTQRLQNFGNRCIFRRAAVFVVGVTLLGVTNAQTRPAAVPDTRCSQQTIDRLEAESDGIRVWSTLHAFYHRYRACRIDDAEVTEGVSESVARLLADHWDTLPVAAKLFGQDPAFETFALAGINITDSTDDLTRIDELAAGSCAPALHRLCRKIRKSVRTNN